MTENHKISTVAFKADRAVQVEIIPFTQLYKNGRNLIERPHRAAFYHILFFESGVNSHSVDFNAIEISPACLLFIKEGAVHKFADLSDAKGCAIIFTESFFYKDQQDFSLLRSSPLFNAIYPYGRIDIAPKRAIFDTLIAQLVTELSSGSGPYKNDILRHLLHTVMLQALRIKEDGHEKPFEPSPELNLLLKFQEKLDVHFKRSRQVYFYADLLAITEKRLNRVTDHVLGKTPKQIIDERIILESKRLLAYSDNSVKDISFTLAFEEPTNFVKYFKKHTKQTPLEFRSNIG